MLELLLILWLLIGAFGFHFWWTTQFEFTFDEFFLMLIVSILGPFSWVVGSFVHGEGIGE